ncbi:SRPBCC family protein [Nocardioides jishulii]|uniref:Polyketide cyclase n=1 Tax=Nocardioides jishulii TaxID=2575440 RepID=A0A4U2YSM8_9ACTN|nr:SRPBCC family protein [Nocardioides jishulii]QCX28939.1 polyketide cyclase [Nocardioides jishulii]TKI64160.1 polyketide cyclase [Nocardioides jishulii]
MTATEHRFHEHRFHETWFVDASPIDVAAVLDDLAAYPTWWPEVVAVAALGGESARVLCRSRLPYVLDLVLIATTRSTERLQVEVDGDLVGWVRFDLSEERGGTRVEFQQEVRTYGWLGLASRLLRPALHWNHHEMMRGCREGLAGAVRVAA